jgi:hypothetical protein
MVETMISINSVELKEVREATLDELDEVSSGGLFTFGLSLGGFSTLATLYEKLGGADVSLGVKPAY